MLGRRVPAWLSGSVLMALGLAALAAIGSVDAGKSRISATFRQMNVPVEGEFRTFRGTVQFDPKNPAAGSARIEIDTGSFDIGAEEYNDEVKRKEWFDTAAHPHALFVSSSVAPAGPNRFTATGELTLKGKTRELRVPFTVRDEGSSRIYEGEVPLSRKAHAIGSADWDDVLEDRVVVKFRVVTATK